MLFNGGSIFANIQWSSILLHIDAMVYRYFFFPNLWHEFAFTRGIVYVYMIGFFWKYCLVWKTGALVLVLCGFYMDELLDILWYPMPDNFHIQHYLHDSLYDRLLISKGPFHGQLCFVIWNHFSLCCKRVSLVGVFFALHIYWTFPIWVN